MQFPIPDFPGDLLRVAGQGFSGSVLRRYFDPSGSVLVPSDPNGLPSWPSFFASYAEEFRLGPAGALGPELAPPVAVRGRAVNAYGFQQLFREQAVLDSFVVIGLKEGDIVTSVVNGLVYGATYLTLDEESWALLMNLETAGLRQLLSLYGMQVSGAGFGIEEAPISISNSKDWVWGRTVPEAGARTYEPVRLARVAVNLGGVPHSFEIGVSVRKGALTVGQLRKRSLSAGVSIRIFNPDPVTAKRCQMVGRWEDPAAEAEFSNLRDSVEFGSLQNGKGGLESRICVTSTTASHDVKGLRVKDLRGRVFSKEQSTLMAFYWIEAFHDYLEGIYGWPFATEKKVEVDPCFEGQSTFEPYLSRPGGLFRFGGYASANVGLTDLVPDALDGAVIIHEAAHLVQELRGFRGGPDLWEGSADAIARIYLDRFDCPGCATNGYVFRYEADVPRKLEANRHYFFFKNGNSSGGHYYGSYWCEAVWKIFLSLSSALDGSARQRVADFLIIALLDSYARYTPPPGSARKAKLGTRQGNKVAQEGHVVLAHCLITSLASLGLSPQGLVSARSVFEVMGLIV